MCYPGAGRGPFCPVGWFQCIQSIWFLWALVFKHESLAFCSSDPVNIPLLPRFYGSQQKYNRAYKGDSHKCLTPNNLAHFSPMLLL